MGEDLAMPLGLLRDDAVAKALLLICEYFVHQDATVDSVAIDDAELDAIEERVNAATPVPWWAWYEGRDGVAGESFIGQGSDEPGTTPQRRDLYLSSYADAPPVPIAAYDFIAHAREDVPRLIAEVRRLRQAQAADKS